MTELLGNVLPGVRSLRAPFSAGAITLLAAWIYYRHDVGHSDRFKAISADVDALRGLTSGTIVKRDNTPEVAGSESTTT